MSSPSHVNGLSKRFNESNVTLGATFSYENEMHAVTHIGDETYGSNFYGNPDDIKTDLDGFAYAGLYVWYYA